MIQVGIIINDTCKLQQDAVRVLQLIDDSLYIKAEIRRTEYPKHATEIAEEWANEKQIIVAIGGDGTCNEVLNGWHKAGEAFCAIGIVPNGTGNDFQTMLPDFDPENFVRNLEILNVHQVDYGVAETDQDSFAFLNISDLGFGAKVVQLLNRQRKAGIRGKMSYNIAILRTFFVFRKRHIHLSIDGNEWHGKVLMIAFCNGSTFGHGLTIHPGMEINNGQLGVTIVGDVSLLTYVSKLRDLKKGRKIRHAQLHYLNAKVIEFDPNSQPKIMEFDGELMEKSVRRIAVVPNGLAIIV